MTEETLEITTGGQASPTVYEPWTAEQLREQAEKLIPIDEQTPLELREQLNTMIRNQIGVNSHHNHIRSLNNPEQARIAYEQRYESYQEQLLEEQLNSHLAAEGIDIEPDALQHDEPDDFSEQDLIIETYSGQIAGEAFFNIADARGDLMDFRDMQWWVIEQNSAWREETRNPAGEHLARNNPDQIQAYYIELDGEPVQPEELESLYETLQLREDLITRFDDRIADLFLNHDDPETIRSEYETTSILRDDPDHPFEYGLQQARELGLITDDNDLTLFGYLSQFDMDSEAIERNNFVQAARDGPMQLYEDGFLRATGLRLTDIDLTDAYTDAYTRSLSLDTSDINSSLNQYNTIDDSFDSYLDDDDDDDLLGNYISDGGLSMDPQDRAVTISNRDLETTLGMDMNQIETMILASIDTISQTGETTFAVETDGQRLELDTLIPDRAEPRRPEAPDPPDQNGLFGGRQTSYTDAFDQDLSYEPEDIYSSLGQEQDDDPVEPTTSTTRRNGTMLEASTEIMIDRGLAELYTIQDELADQDIDLPALDDNSSFQYDLAPSQLSADAQTHLEALDHLDYIEYDEDSGRLEGNRTSSHTKYLLPATVELQIETLEMPGTAQLETTLGYEQTEQGLEPTYAMRQLEQAWDPRETPDTGYRETILETAVPADL